MLSDDNIDDDVVNDIINKHQYKLFYLLYSIEINNLEIETFLKIIIIIWCRTLHIVHHHVVFLSFSSC